MRKLPMVLAALVISAVAVAATATAVSPPISTEMLKFFSGGAGTIAWTSEGGSSTADNQALKLSGTTQGTDYSGAYAIAATSSGALLSDFNASFDIKGYQGAGSPRISLPVDTNNDGTTDMWAYLSAFYSSGDARTPADNGFEHLDFQNSDSTIYTSSATVLNGLSDPLNATGSISYEFGGFTFDVNDAASRAGWRVATDEQPFLILDEAPAVSYVDNLTIGNFNWQRPGRIGFVNNLPLAGNVQSDEGTMHWTNDAGDSFDVDVEDVWISGGIVAFSGFMEDGEGQWAAYDGQVIQEYIDTNTNDLYGLIGAATPVAPTSTTGLQGPFTFTGTVTIS